MLLFDARVLGEPHLSGIGFYTRDLLFHLLQDEEIQQEFSPTLFFNAHHPTPHRNFRYHLKSLPPHHELIGHNSNKWLFARSLINQGPHLKGQRKNKLIHLPHLSSLTQPQIKKICTIHDLAFERFPHFLSPKERWWHQLLSYKAKQADHFLAVSYSTKEDLIRLWGIAPEQISVIYQGLSLQSQQPSNNSPKCKKRPYLLFVGSSEKRKNLPRLLTAFHHLIQKQRFQHYRLYLAGQAGNDEMNVQKSIATLNLQKHVHRFPYLSAKKKTAFV